MIRYRLYIILFFLILSTTAMAQRGEIFGTVIDVTTNEPLPGVNVQLLNTTIGAATNLEGEFRITGIPPGTYAVRAGIIGYTPITESDIVVTPIRPIELNFELRETVIEFGEITVTPDFFSTSEDKPISVQVQTAEEIRRLPGGFEDVVRAVSVLPGVAQVSAGRNDLIVRGGAPSENLYVVDGLELNNINHFGTQGASGGPQSYINLDFVEKTEFSTGGFGARYGDKLSSVLSIDLREGRKDRLGGKATISATQFGLSLEGPIGNKGSYIFSARRSYLDLVFRAAGFGFVPEYWDFLGKATYEINTNNKLTFLGLGALDNTRFFNDTEEQQLDNSTVLGNSQDQGIAGLTWRHIFKNGFTTLTLGQNSVDYTFEQSDSNQNPIFTNNSGEYETSLTGNVLYKLTPNTEFTAGAQGKFIQFNADLFLPTFFDYYGNRLSVNADYDSTGYKAAGWLQVSHYFPQLKVIAGLRYDRFSLIEKKNAWSPRVAVEYSLNNLTSIKGSVGFYHQAPSYIWTVSNERNRELEYIQVMQYIVGVEHLLRDDTRMKVELYYKDYDKYPASLTRPYLVLANTGGGFGGAQEGFESFGLDPLVSEGTGRSRGVELSVQKKLSDVPAYGIMSVTYNQTNFTALDGIERPGSYDQRWIFNLGGGYIFNERWQISSRFRFYTGQPYTPFNDDFTKTVDNYNAARIPSNHYLDFRVDRFWYFDRFMLVTFLDIQNLYNRPLVSEPRFDPVENSLENQGSIGILPSIGISMMF